MCRKINDRRSFFVYPYEEKLDKSEAIKTCDLIKQLENLSVSTSDYEPSTKIPKIKLKKKMQRTKMEDENISNLSNDDVKSRDSPCSKTESRDVSNDQVKSHAVLNEEIKSHDLQSSDQKSSSGNSTDGKDADWKPDDPSEMAMKKQCQRRKKDSKDRLKTLLDEIPEEMKTEILISNELISLKHIKENIQNLRPDEFLTKQFHIMSIDKKWSEQEIRIYANYFGKKPSYMMELVQINCLQSIGHRKSFQQQYKHEEINLILQYILENAMPSANCERDIVIKRKSLIQNKSKRLFYE